MSFLNGKSHEEILKEGWEYAGSADVDAGIIHIGDPCYILPCKRVDKDIPLDYDEYLGQLEEDEDYEGQPILTHVIEALTECVKKGISGPEMKDILEKARDREKKEFEEWAKKQQEKMITGGFTQLKHEKGHPGMGVCIKNFGGDGTYNVYVQRSKKGGIVAAMIKFGWMDDWSEEEDE